jgi:hypothetical protein
MARPYSQKFLVELFQNDKPTMGVELGRLCINANLNTAHIAKAFEVSRATIHSWFRGAVIRKSRHQLVLSFISLVNKDTESGVLPVANAKDSKSYIESMLGKEI